MSLGGKKGQSTTDTRLEGINVNQSNYGNAIPLLYGQNRIPLMLLDYVNFIATPHTQSQGGGKGGGGGSSNTTFTYSASLVMGLCEGPIAATGQVWQDKVITTITALGLTLFSGTSGQAVWSYLTTNFPSHAIPYDRVGYVAIANYALGSSAALPNFTFETTGLVPFNLGTVNDAEPSAILVDYCTNPIHGASYPASALNTTAFQGAGVLSWQSYCIAMGFFFSPYEDTQRPAADFIKELLQMTNSDAFMSAGVMNIVPYADTSVTGNGRTYTPNLTPLFAFTDDDFMPASADSGGSAGADPVIVDRQPLADTYNTVVIEYLDRSNAYNTAIAQATDAQDIAVNGVRVMGTLTFHSITTGAVAQQVAQLILQRQLYIRSTFTFSVRADYCLLEPMDLVSITDTVLGINNRLVRITEVDDDENDNITIVAEDMLVGSATAPAYNFQPGQGFAANYGVTPPAVATPLLFSAPPALVSQAGGYEMWIAVDQATTGSWGGCDVYTSLDGTSYIYVGTINGAARYGTLTANLASHADPDTVDTLAVALTNAATTPLQLVSGSATDFNNLRTLIYVDGEIMAYQTATLTSAGHYNLTTLRRGQYGSSPGAHLSASSFARIDAGIFRMPYDPGMIGQTMHFKFCSFNVFGKMTQTLAAATDYTHVLAATNAGQLTPGPLTLVGRNVTVNGNSVFKSGGVNSTWDSDVYSVQGYTNGAFASWQPVNNTDTFMIALNSDPTTDSSYTSLDYALYCSGTGGGAGLAVFNSGSVVFSGLAYSAGDLLTVSYDGSFVRYSQNGTVFYQQPAPPNLTLYLDSSFNNSQATATNLQFGPYGTATPVLWIPRGGAAVSDEAITKVSGSAGVYDCDAYSINGYTQAHIVFKTGTGGTAIAGFVSGAPPATIARANVSYGIEVLFPNTVNVVESGTVVATPGTFSTGDFFSITYNGTTVTYSQNGTVIHTTTVSGLTMYGEVAIAANFETVNSLEFGPGALIPLADTGQINTNAATTTVSTTVTGTSAGANFAAPTSQNSVTVGPFPVATTVVVTANASYTAVSAGLGTSIAIEYGISTSSSSFSGNIVKQLANPTTPTSTNQTGVLSCEATFSLAAGVTQTYFFVSGLNPSGVVGSGQNFDFLTLKAEVIKR